MRAFEEQAEGEFAARLAANARENFSEETSDLSDEELREMLRKGVARAKSHGLSWESSIAGFITLMFNIAPNFDEHPAFKRVLSAPVADEDDRLAAVFSDVSPKEWEEAEDAYDEAAWGAAEAEG